MAAFKKGDWVRMTDNCHEGGYKSGDVFRLTGVTKSGVQFTDKDGDSRNADFGSNRFEPWQPKVGERVRVVKHVNSRGDDIPMALAIGSEHTVSRVGDALGDRSRPTFDLSGGGHQFYTALNLEPVIDAPVAEQPAALKIEAGKFYKTRDGRKVGPVDTNPDNFNVGMDFFGREAAAVIPEIGDVDASGFWLCGDGNSDHDIIAERQDAPTTNTAAQVDTLADEYGPVVREVPVAQQQARFKVGDRVECTLGLGVATVKEVRADGRFRVDWDNGDVGVNWWRDSDFTLARRVATPTPAIVCKIDKGQPLPAHRPHVHATVEAADKEAARLAELHTGQEFGVFALTGAPHRVAKVYEHEWQRLAVAGEKVQAIKALRNMAALDLVTAKRAVEVFVDKAA